MSTYLNIFMPLLFALMAGFFIFIALKILFARRPIVFSARWLFGFICLAFLPSIVTPLIIGFSRRHLSTLSWITIVMFIVMLIFFWIQMKGYVVIAISDTYFREALLSSAAIQGWIGTAQIKATDRRSVDVVTKIATGMNQYFKTSPGKMNYLTSYFYLIMGVFMTICSVAMLVLRNKG